MGSLLADAGCSGNRTIVWIARVIASFRRYLEAGLPKNSFEYRDSSERIACGIGMRDGGRPKNDQVPGLDVYSRSIN
jgi:hypothetical protein